MYISVESNIWSNSTESCQGNKQVGGEELEFCRAEACRPGQLLEIEDLPGRRDVLWLNGYVVKSPVLQHDDCYQVEKMLTDSITTKTTFVQNNASMCSNFCSLEQKGKPGNYIYLQGNNCYCVERVTHEFWLNTNKTKIRETDACNVTCVGQNVDRCGGNHTLFHSVYIYRFDNIKGAFTELDEINHHCIYVDGNGDLKYTSCNETKSFICSRKIVSGETGIRRYNTCHSSKFSWYDARKICKNDQSFIRTPNAKYCGLGSKWHGSFRTEEIIWNRITRYPVYDQKCLAVSVRQNNEFRLLALECKQRHKSLCIRNNVIPNSPTTEIPSTEIIIGVVLAIVLTVITIIAVVKTRVCRNKEVSDQQRKRYTVNNLGSNTVPQSNRNSQYNYIDISEENGLNGNDILVEKCLVTDGDVYNHLREDMVTKMTGNAYGHVGPTESEYDISATSTTRPQGDDKDTLYDHTMTVHENIYDKSDTRP